LRERKGRDGKRKRERRGGEGKGENGREGRAFLGSKRNLVTAQYLKTNATQKM